MASLTRWTSVWVNSRRCWWTERPGMLRFIGSQRIGDNWATELNWTELNWIFHCMFVPSLVAQLVENTPAMQETLVRFLGLKDPLEKGTATHSSTLAWRIPWTRESMGSQSWTRLSDFHFHLMYICTHMYVYTAHLPYSHVCWWALRLLPCLGSCK